MFLIFDQARCVSLFSFRMLATGSQTVKPVRGEVVEQKGELNTKPEDAPVAEVACKPKAKAKATMEEASFE